MSRLKMLALLTALSLVGPVPLKSAVADSGEKPHATNEGEGDHDHPQPEDGAGHAAEDGSVKPLATDPDLAIWTFVVFACLLLLLKKFAWGPIIEALAAREAGISDNIAAAAAKHEEAKKLLCEHQAKIDAAADDVREMLEEARRDAEVTKNQIVAEAREAAVAERKRALREIEIAKEGAVKGLAEHSANLAIDLATQVVRKDITQERQNEIAREALARMSSGETSSN